MSDIKDAKSLTEAIAILEKAGQSKVDDFKKVFEKDFSELKKNVDDLKPMITDFKSTVDTQVSKSKSEIEAKIIENPWLTIATVGIFAFFIGCLFGNNKHDKKDTPK